MMPAKARKCRSDSAHRRDRLGERGQRPGGHAATNSDELLAEYRQRVSPLDQWLSDEGWLVAVDGSEAARAFVSTDRLYEVYRHWYQNYTGEKYPKFMPKVAFGKKLASRFAAAQPVMPNGKRPRGYRGVQVRPDWDRTWSDDFG
jgi:hypothetical protein